MIIHTLHTNITPIYILHVCIQCSCKRVKHNIISLSSPKLFVIATYYRLSLPSPEKMCCSLFCARTSSTTAEHAYWVSVRLIKRFRCVHAYVLSAWMQRVNVAFRHCCLWSVHDVGLAVTDSQLQQTLVAVGMLTSQYYTTWPMLHNLYDCYMCCILCIPQYMHTECALSA